MLTHTYETFLGPDLIKAIHNKRVGRGDYSGSYVFEVDFSEDGAPATLEAPESTAAVAPVTTALDPTVEDQLDSFVKDNLPESSPLREARDRGIPWPTIAIAAGLTAGASGRQAPAEADAERAG